MFVNTYYCVRKRVFFVDNSGENVSYRKLSERTGGNHQWISFSKRCKWEKLITEIGWKRGRASTPKTIIRPHESCVYTYTGLDAVLILCDPPADRIPSSRPLPLHPTRVSFGDGTGWRQKGQRKNWQPFLSRTQKISPGRRSFRVSADDVHVRLALLYHSAVSVSVYRYPLLRALFCRIFSLLFIYSFPFGHKRSTYIVRHASWWRGPWTLPCLPLLDCRPYTKRQLWSKRKRVSPPVRLTQVKFKI